MESILSSCSSGYDNVVQTLEETEKIVATQGTQVDLNTKLSDAVTSAGDCDNAFQDFPEMKDPFLAMQRNVWRLVDNVLNIAVVVKQSGDAHAH
jgi:pectinesterase inhibitor-like protein